MVRRGDVSLRGTAVEGAGVGVAVLGKAGQEEKMVKLSSEGLV